MRRVLTALSGVALLLAGCAHHIDGAPAHSSRVGHQTFFFEGDVPVYGQQVSRADIVRLTYLRALRRIDVCGLTSQDSVAKFGEIYSLGTLLALDECDLDVKEPGRVGARFVSGTVELAEARGPVVAAEGVTVRETYQGSCEYLVPIDLAGLPGAGELPGPEQPHLRIGMVAEPDCAVVARVATEIAAHVARTPIPPRDGAAAYTTALAERDPCEVLGVLDVGYWDVGYWDIAHSAPYRCEFGIVRGGEGEPVPLQVSLRPRVVDVSVEGRELIRTGDTEVYLDRQSCSALVFVGPDLRRRLGNGALVDTGDLRIRTAIDVESAETDCADSSLVEEVAGQAGALYG